MIHDLHMLNEKNNKKTRCIFCSNFKFGSLKDVTRKKTLICFEEKKTFQDYSLISKPMILGKEVELDIAITEIKNIIKHSKSIHLDGMDCDISSIDKVFDFAEKKKCSINHKDAENISNLYLTFQKYGGSFVSFNEIRHRSDLLIFIGITEDEFCNEFFEKLMWNNKKIKDRIFFFGARPKIKRFNHIESRNENFFDDISILNLRFSEKNNNRKDKFSDLEDAFFKSKYPVILTNVEKFNAEKIFAIYDLVYSVNKSKRLKIFNFFGLNNSSGFINSCVTKTGYPNAISFTDKGSEYDPFQIKNSLLKKITELQIYVSNFGNFASVNLFKKNIFIGNPNLDNKKKFDVYIPAKTPGIDKKGIAVRSDGISVIKLKKFIDSSYNSIEEIFNRISGS